MEEKKLTDDEIVKDIERSTGMPSYWKKIVLDLIHRLQDENERLTEENEILKGNPPMCVGRRNGKTIMAKLLDYDRLKKQHDELCKANPNIVILIEASERKYKELYDEAKGILQHQAVKDTAKEIATELLETKIKIGNEYYVFANNIKVIAKRKGVEVE